MRFELFVAARYLRARRRQAVIGVITTISIIGVAAGVELLPSCRAERILQAVASGLLLSPPGWKSCCPS